MSNIKSLKNLILFVLIVMIGTYSGNARADSWADAMFEVKKHDFGRVALGADARFSFTFENIFEEEVHIASVSSSCYCTEPVVIKDTLKTWEKGEIVAKFNTSGQFVKEKGATITVVFDKPFHAEVQLQISGYIRPDVVITPGTLEFGTVQEGETVKQVVLVEYAGNPDWRLLEVRQNNPLITAEILDFKQNGGEITYQLLVSLHKGSAVGYIHDVLHFITNERQLGANGRQESSYISLPVRAEVSAPLFAKPSPFNIGVLKQGDNVRKNLVLRGSVPFKILGVDPGDSRYDVTYSEEESSVHILPISFTASGGNSGTLSNRLKIRTNRKDQEYLNVEVQGYLYSDEAELVPAKMQPNRELAKTEPPQRQPEMSVISADPDVETAYVARKEFKIEVEVVSEPEFNLEKELARDISAEITTETVVDPVAEQPENIGIAGRPQRLPFMETAVNPQVPEKVAPPYVASETLEQTPGSREIQPNSEHQILRPVNKDTPLIATKPIEPLIQTQPQPQDKPDSQPQSQPGNTEDYWNATSGTTGRVTAQRVKFGKPKIPSTVGAGTNPSKEEAPLTAEKPVAGETSLVPLTPPGAGAVAPRFGNVPKQQAAESGNVRRMSGSSSPQKESGWEIMR